MWPALRRRRAVWRCATGVAVGDDQAELLRILVGIGGQVVQVVLDALHAQRGAGVVLGGRGRRPRVPGLHSRRAVVKRHLSKVAVGVFQQERAEFEEIGPLRRLVLPATGHESVELVGAVFRTLHYPPVDHVPVKIINHPAC